MVIYTCEKCNKTFKQKGHYTTHMNKKNSCIPIVDIRYNELNKEPLTSKIVKEKMDNNLCPYCDKTFSRKDTIIQHMKHHCKILKQMENERETIFQQLLALKEQYDVLSKDVEVLKSSTRTRNKNSNITNSGQIENSSVNTYNITLNNFLAGQMPDGITQAEIDKALKRGFLATVELTRIAHFNPRFPEYHNVYIPRINERHGMVYWDGIWKVVDRDELVDDIYNGKRDFVVNNIDTFISRLDTYRRESLERWLEIEDDRDESLRQTKEDIKRLLYENRHLVIDTKKTISEYEINV